VPGAGTEPRKATRRRLSVEKCGQITLVSLSSSRSRRNSTPPPSAPPEPPAPEAEPPEPAPEASAPPEPPDFEFETLETRLRETKALGFFTKLELKNQIDGLMQEVRDYHQQEAGNLPEIREEFDLLVMKVMTLLQDEEAELASEIANARGELWAILADPQRFAELEAT
jgi:hypothetical protein